MYLQGKSAPDAFFLTQPDPSSMRSGGLDLSMRPLEGACSVGTNRAAMKNPAIDVAAAF